MVHKYPLRKEETNGFPPIGNKYLHKGGNVWRVIEYANIGISWENFYKEIGPCVFLECVSGGLYISNRKPDPCRWEINQFWQDFDNEPIWF